MFLLYHTYFLFSSPFSAFLTSKKKYWSVVLGFDRNSDLAKILKLRMLWLRATIILHPGQNRGVCVCRILRSSNWEEPGIGPEQSSTCGCTSRITIVWQAYRLINHSKMVTRNCHVTLRSASVRKKSILFIVWQIEVNELLQTKSDKRKRACYCCSWCSYGIYDEACTQLLLLFSLKS